MAKRQSNDDVLSYIKNKPRSNTPEQQEIKKEQRVLGEKPEPEKSINERKEVAFTHEQQAIIDQINRGFSKIDNDDVPEM